MNYKKQNINKILKSIIIFLFISVSATCSIFIYFEKQKKFEIEYGLLSFIVTSVIIVSYIAYFLDLQNIFKPFCKEATVVSKTVENETNMVSFSTAYSKYKTKSVAKVTMEFEYKNKKVKKYIFRKKTEKLAGIKTGDTVFLYNFLELPVKKETNNGE